MGPFRNKIVQLSDGSIQYSDEEEAAFHWKSLEEQEKDEENIRERLQGLLVSTLCYWKKEGQRGQYIKHGKWDLESITSS